MTNQEFIESIRLENEEWRPVVGWEDYYMVSSFGRVVSLIRFKRFSDRNGYYTKPRIKIQTLGFGKDPYYVVQLNNNNEQHTYKTHRLVAEAFIPNPNNLNEVDHINRNTKDNRVCNLRWCSHKENMNNKNTTSYMSSVHKGKLLLNSRKPVVCLKNNSVIKTYNYVVETEKDGFAPSAVSAACIGKKPQYKGFCWMYLSDYKKTLANQDVNELSTDA